MRILGLYVYQLYTIFSKGHCRKKNHAVLLNSETFLFGIFIRFTDPVVWKEYLVLIVFSVTFVMYLCEFITSLGTCGMIPC